MLAVSPVVKDFFSKKLHGGGLDAGVISVAILPKLVEETMRGVAKRQAELDACLASNRVDSQILSNILGLALSSSSFAVSLPLNLLLSNLMAMVAKKVFSYTKGLFTESLRSNPSE